MEEEGAVPADAGGGQQARFAGEEEHAPSRVDAMGQDKHRQIVGHSYGPSRQRQLVYYGIFLAIVVLVYIGASFAVSQLDKAPSNASPQAPWAQPKAPQVPPQQFQ